MTNDFYTYGGVAKSLVDGFPLFVRVTVDSMEETCVGWYLYVFVVVAARVGAVVVLPSHQVKSKRLLFCAEAGGGLLLADASTGVAVGVCIPRLLALFFPFGSHHRMIVVVVMVVVLDRQTQP